uniref:Uncharacterized protein n=1 Tax=viral metagenome TaxID=1070528 RepID=A0A6C0F745_9ZZZZ|tara:strand:+ start:5836 stop:8055 length:2220 start_codon:yes stop_codon:yes gene_type:complete
MKLTLIGLFIIIIIMLLVQISFRDNFDLMKQKAFRNDQINYNLKHLTLIQSDGKEIECGELNSDKTNINKKTICEGYESMAENEYALAAEKCSIVNGIKDWRVRANRIPETGPTETKGCGFCYDTKNVYYGDEKGPFKDIGPRVCNNWIKPGGYGIGGTNHKKNIFGVYPFEDDLYKTPSNKNLQFGQGVVKDTIKMYEQDLCRQMKNCGDQNIMGADGTPLCGWCTTGRKGDGEGEGMVRKGGTDKFQNETKYDDDFCHWTREINEKGQKTFLYKKETKELKEWRGNSGKPITITIGDLSGTSVTLDNPGRLMNGLKHCAASAQLFPCFPNFTGNVANENGEIKHSKRCYDDIWRNYALYKDTVCNGDIKDRINNEEHGLPQSRTFRLWDKTFIPSVETAVQKIPERMETSKQYEPNYPGKDGMLKKKDSKGWFLQNMFSALLNSKVCTNEEPDSCDDKYRSREYNFFRSKDCIDNIIVNNIPNNWKNISGILKTDKRYIPGNDSTYQYYWPVYNDPIWKEGIHFDWSKEEYKKKLEEKWEDVGKKQDCKTKGNVNEMYDKALVAIKYLLGTEKKEMDIIETLGVKLWQDDDGGTSGSWVKMCWEDFRLELKTVWGNDDPSFINKHGKINITSYPEIISLIMDDSKFYHRVLSYKDDSTGINVPVELTGTGQTYITKQNYLHKYFPFWRLWKGNTKYYIKSEYRTYVQAKEKTNLANEKAYRKKKNEYASTQYKLSVK